MGWCLDCHRNSNYVGGPNYHGTAESFTVGSANYDVVRHPLRTPADAVVTFTEREVKSAAAAITAPGGADAHGTAHDQAAAASTRTARASTHQAFINGLKAHPTLPRWRVADLPETHREAYKSLYEKDGNGELIVDLSKTFMNAPTQCSTCHQ
jgi:hypothetical protein